MKTLLVFTKVLLLAHSVYCVPCTKVESLDITSGTILTNGSIEHNGVLYNPETWYDKEEEGVLKRYGCPCIQRTCIWKCCASGLAYLEKNCSDTDLDAVNPFSPPVYNDTQLLSLQSHQHFFYMYASVCEDMYMVDTMGTYEELFIQENGTLLEVYQGHQLWHPPATYCVDMMVDNRSTAGRMIAKVCYPEVVSTDDSPGLYIAYAIGLLLSTPFLLATFLVYAFIPELRNVHGLCLMAYCWGLIIAYIFLAFLKLQTGQVIVNKTGCLVIAFIVYYSFQTSFFWLNVMCFDIWRTFSGYRGGSKNKRRERRRFALYGLYAWGVPVLLTAITAGMQFNELPLHIVTPGFGDRRCWFEDWLSELVYFFMPVLVLVVCNVILFSVTAYRIRSIKQETAILKSAESSRSDKLKKDKQRYGLYLKLFLVMGVNWTVELISFAVGGSNWYWVVVDISNIMLGLFIFIIFVWKNKVRNLIMKRWRGTRGRPSTTEGTGRWATRSSSAPTEDTRITSEYTTVRLKDMR